MKVLRLRLPSHPPLLAVYRLVLDDVLARAVPHYFRDESFVYQLLLDAVRAVPRTLLRAHQTLPVEQEEVLVAAELLLFIQYWVCSLRARVLAGYHCLFGTRKVWKQFKTEPHSPENEQAEQQTKEQAKPPGATATPRQAGTASLAAACFRWFCSVYSVLSRI